MRVHSLRVRQAGDDLSENSVMLLHGVQECASRSEKWFSGHSRHERAPPWLYVPARQGVQEEEKATPTEIMTKM